MILITVIGFHYGVYRMTFGPSTIPSNSDSFQIASLSGWFFFVLLNAFYGGALTMFFVSLPTLPFEDIISVLQAYPDWKLVFLDVSILTF